MELKDYSTEELKAELKRRADEATRHLLVRFVECHMPENYSNCITKEECLAWLENQGKNKL